jgi:hypothetical protein
MDKIDTLLVSILCPNLVKTWAANFIQQNLRNTSFSMFPWEMYILGTKKGIYFGDEICVDYIFPSHTV